MDPFYLCGDLNSRIGNMDDFIPGVDFLPERDVIDFKANSYGEIFCEFLSNVNCCVLNGRNGTSNDFTFVSTRGSSVVDYCVVPYECLKNFTNFQVIRASVLFNQSVATGSSDPKYIPDHSVLCWEMESALCESVNNEKSSYSICDTSNQFIYNVKNIPDNWMKDESVRNLINLCISNIESCNGSQFEIDNLYDDFVNIMHNEMDNKLDKKVKILNGRNNKRRRFKKQWWNDELTLKWNTVCVAENQYLHCTHKNNKVHLRQVYLNRRKEFDKLVQQTKRQYWHRCQDELVNLNNNDPRQFWRKIGNIGIGNERQSSIPNEVVLDDGSVTDNLGCVLNKWKNSFYNLLNLNDDRNNDVKNFKVKNNISCNFLDNDISFDEVYKVVMNAKNGKSPGVDFIQSELCKNYIVICTLTKLFDLCFKSGKIPNTWNKGIITPIPKCSTTDPRDPLSYRGITLAPCAYKLYCGILNNRLTEWLDEREIISDEQNGFIKGRSTIDHISTLTSIIETRKKCKLSTFVAFIDFKKAYDSIDRFLLFNKLENLGISTKFMFALKAIYTNVESCVRINGHVTEWFSVNTGLKQGCVLSTVLFNIFINNLVDDIKALNVGIDIDGEKNSNFTICRRCSLNGREY